jgi:hypothetical protein
MLNIIVGNEAVGAEALLNYGSVSTQNDAAHWFRDIS